MQTIDSLVHSVQIIAVVLIILLLMIAVAGVYFFKFHRGKITEKAIDYSTFKRMDTTEYVKFDDVAENMVITDGKKRFVGGISCTGCEFRDLEDEEQLQVIRGYLSFINVLDTQSVQYWQMARDVDLDKMVEDYKNQLVNKQERQYLLTLDYEEMKKESERIPDTDTERYEEYYRTLRQMQREITSIGYQVEQLRVQIKYLESISGEKADPHLEQIYLFDWTYNALDFTQELSESEIYAKAERQLENKASAYISALRNCGVKAKLLSGVEILEQMRRYTHPISAAKYRVEDILQSAYDSIATTSNSLRNAEEKSNANMLSRIAAEFEAMEQEENVG